MSRGEEEVDSQILPEFMTPKIVRYNNKMVTVLGTKFWGSLFHSNRVTD